MRFLLTVIVLAGAGYFGYNYYLNHKEEVDQKIAALTEKVKPGENEMPGRLLTGTSRSPPSNPRSKYPLARPARRSSPLPGSSTWSIVSASRRRSGIQAINPGEQVKLLARMKNGRMKMAQGAIDFEVKETQVTNDLERAQQAEKSDFVARGGRL